MGELEGVKAVLSHAIAIITLPLAIFCGKVAGLFGKAQ
jgi:hypothetical protein